MFLYFLLPSQRVIYTRPKPFSKFSIRVVYDVLLELLKNIPRYIIAYII